MLEWIVVFRMILKILTFGMSVKYMILFLGALSKELKEDKRSE